MTYLKYMTVSIRRNEIVITLNAAPIYTKENWDAIISKLHLFSFYISDFCECHFNGWLLSLKSVQ